MLERCVLLHAQRLRAWEKAAGCITDPVLAGQPPTPCCLAHRASTSSYSGPVHFSPLLSTESAVCPVCTCLPTPCVYGFSHSNQLPTLSEKPQRKWSWSGSTFSCRTLSTPDGNSSPLTEHINPGFNNLSSDSTRLPQSPVCHVSKQACPSW